MLSLSLKCRKSRTNSHPQPLACVGANRYAYKFFRRNDSLYSFPFFISFSSVDVCHGFAR
jgi:hypothetical protein